MTEVLHPVVLKTVSKGTIALAIFSLFLQISAQNLIGFVSFVALYYVFLGAYVYQKKANSYTLERDEVEIKSLFRAPRTIRYSDVESIAVSQGFLAKRFNCGTVYLNLKHAGGRIKVLGGGSAEAIRDVKDPEACREQIESKIGSSENTQF